LLWPAASDNAGGFRMSEVAGAGMRIMGMGLSMEQVRSVSRDALGGARKQVGAKTVDETVIAILGLSQFM
jgi:hypothetical protein